MIKSSYLNYYNALKSQIYSVLDITVLLFSEIYVL